MTRTSVSLLYFWGFLKDGVYLVGMTSEARCLENGYGKMVVVSGWSMVADEGDGCSCGMHTVE